MSVTRVLVLLLVLRVFAAPIGLPDSHHARSHHPLTLRVCKWPPQRPQRPNLAAARASRRPDDAAPLPEHATCVARARASRFDLGRCERSGTRFVHVLDSDRARC